MTLFTRSCHGPNGRFTLSCAGSVFGTQLMPYFVNSTSIVSNNLIRRYIRVKFKVMVNLGQSSCYFDLGSNFQLDLPRSKSIPPPCHFAPNWDRTVGQRPNESLGCSGSNGTRVDLFRSYLDPSRSGQRKKDSDLRIYCFSQITFELRKIAEKFKHHRVSLFKTHRNIHFF